MLPSFQVLICNNLIKVNLEGCWDISSDLAYLNQLSAAMKQVRDKPWGLLVDMRGWRVSEEMINFKQKTIFHMDRRNQIAECWLVEDLSQGAHLIHFIEKANIPLKRCTSVSSGRTWLNQYGIDF